MNFYQQKGHNEASSAEHELASPLSQPALDREASRAANICRGMAGVGQSTPLKSGRVEGAIHNLSIAIDGLHERITELEKQFASVLVERDELLNPTQESPPLAESILVERLNSLRAGVDLANRRLVTIQSRCQL